jgi:hypothetical protein
LPSKNCPTHLYLFSGRAFPLLVCWSSDGDVTIFPSSLLSIQCCGSRTVPNKLRTTSSRSLLIPLASPSLRRKYSRCTSGYLRRPLFQSAVSAAGADSSTLLPFPVLHHSSANVCTPWALAFQLRLAPGQRVPNAAHRHFQAHKRISVSLLYYRIATGLFSSSAFSVVPVANVLACRRRLPPATPRAGSSSLLTSLSRFTSGIPQHIVRLGQLSATVDPTPALVSSCFSWLLSIAARRLPKSPCRMRHIEQTRRVVVDNLVSSLSLAAYPRTG